METTYGKKYEICEQCGIGIMNDGRCSACNNGHIEMVVA
jgi:hypothetical protein